MSYLTQDLEMDCYRDTVEIEENKKKYGNIFRDDLDYLDENNCIKEHKKLSNK